MTGRSHFPTLAPSKAKRAGKSERVSVCVAAPFECLSVSMIMLVSALMCVRRKRPLSDAGGVQLSKLVASMGEHLSSARRTGGKGPPKPPPGQQLFLHRRTNGRQGLLWRRSFWETRQEP